MKLPRLAVMAGLAIILALALWYSWQTVWRGSGGKTNQTLPVLRADLRYWICMFIAGTLGTVIGDYSSHWSTVVAIRGFHFGSPDAEPAAEHIVHRPRAGRLSHGMARGEAFAEYPANWLSTFNQSPGVSPVVCDTN
jgi:hypothetical protein